MIVVLPIEDRELLAQLFLKESVPFGKNAFGVAAQCGEELLGYCLFDLTERGITVHSLVPSEDLMLADGILRSALHVASERSAMDARYSSTAPVETLKKLQFVSDEKERRLDIDKLFRGCQCGKGEKF